MTFQFGDAIADLNRNIERLNKTLGNADLDGEDTPANWGGLRTLRPGQYRIYETADLDDANADGTITLEPGDVKTIVEAENDSGVMCLSVGANDVTDVQYQLYVDNQWIVGGTTNSPVGTVNSPFSFVDQFHAVIPAQHRIEYRAVYDPNAGTEADIAARMHVEELR